MSKRFYSRYFIALADIVKEFLLLSDNGFPHQWDLHRALFYMEMIVYAETNYGFVRRNKERMSLTFERQDWLDAPYPVCVQLPDTIARMEASREIEIDRSPMFPLEKARYRESHFLRFSRIVLRCSHKPMLISEERKQLMSDIVANVCRRETNNISLLPWERVIRASAHRPGARISYEYSALLKPPEPVRALEQDLSEALTARKVRSRPRNGI